MPNSFEGTSECAGFQRPPENYVRGRKKDHHRQLYHGTNNNHTTATIQITNSVSKKSLKNIEEKSSFN